MRATCLFLARSRSVARSGIRPVYQNSAETVRVGRTANTSQISGLRNCGQIPIVFGIREQPVGRQPRTAGVDQREHRRAGDREQRHRFGEAVDRRAPVLLEQQQDRGDQRAGVADADPPHEVDDVERPADRDVVAPDADALEQQVAERDHQHVDEQEADAEKDEPADGMARPEDDPADLLGDRLERVPRLDDRGRRRIVSGGFGSISAVPSGPRDAPAPAQDSGCGSPRDTWCAAGCSGPRGRRSCAAAP